MVNLHIQTACIHYKLLSFNTVPTNPRVNDYLKTTTITLRKLSNVLSNKNIYKIGLTQKKILFGRTNELTNGTQFHS